MQTVGSKVLFSLPGKERKDYHTMANGEKIYMDTKFDAMFKVQQVGTIEVTNHRLEKDGLTVGSKIIVHHFCIGESTKKEAFVSAAQDVLGQKLYPADANGEIFATVEEDGEIVPYKDYCFVFSVSRINTSHENLSKLGLELPSMTESEIVRQVGILVWPSKELEEQGAKSGDYIIFTKNSEYEVEVDREFYYIMETEDVVAVIDEEVLKEIDVVK